MGLNGFDWVVMIVVGGFTLFGLRHGLVSQLLTLVAVIAAILAASHLGSLLRPLADRLGAARSDGDLIAVVVGFILVFAGMRFAASVARGSLRRLHLGWLDHLLGALVGLAAGSVAASALAIVTGTLVRDGDRVLRQSRLAPYVLTVSRATLSLVPRETRERFIKQQRDLLDV